MAAQFLKGRIQMVADFDVSHYRPIIGTVTVDGEECGYRNADIAVVVFFTGLYLLQPARYFFIMVKSAAADGIIKVISCSIGIPPKNNSSCL